ncbi:hypothetical protein Pa4123_85040 [Phytohabitans aurantiacus]|uniref:Uncharacterized protein n=1 Tax=Phytohabitans aurantiacus TaxID=3016789 RepID=A0ABQ5R8X6_9ACTN|nr:hypothetical protein Pa4123_85040 [Phytohabitans aurantiacus]
MRLDDRLRVVAQQTGRPQLVGQVVALGGELVGEPAVQYEHAIAEHTTTLSRGKTGCRVRGGSGIVMTMTY